MKERKEINNCTHLNKQTHKQTKSKQTNKQKVHISTAASIHLTLYILRSVLAITEEELIRLKIKKIRNSKIQTCNQNPFSRTSSERSPVKTGHNETTTRNDVPAFCKLTTLDSGQLLERRLEANVHQQCCQPQPDNEWSV